MKEVRIFYLVVLMLFGCTLKSNTGEDTPKEIKRSKVMEGVKKIIIPNHLIPVFDTTAKYNIFYLFNGGCSTCVISLMEAIKSISVNQGIEAKQTRIYFIDTNNNTASVRFFLDKYNIIIGDNQYIVADPNSEFVNFNNITIQPDGTSVTLADELLLVKEERNPFSDDNAMALYRSLGIFSKETQKSFPK